MARGNNNICTQRRMEKKQGNTLSKNALYQINNRKEHRKYGHFVKTGSARSILL